ncbi:bZIP transcription factor 17-like [Juglans microcarpa x Juglans regia]|uniref:bZIP transcription factor 17-like n=1 Tax=Juglans microcarpa x Juglans regia TaxID=2249226 RepID=UPI001B7DB1EA|nr:bZIP transcription factor 17-like [Juglans microcarpa x Juglans regia]
MADRDFQSLSSAFDSIPIPPLDSMFTSEENNNVMSSETYMSDLGMELGLNENADFDFTFDDLEDLYLPYETEQILISDGIDALQLPSSAAVQPVQLSNSSSQDSGASGISGDRGSEVARFLNSSASESDRCGLESSPRVFSDNFVLNVQSLDSGGCDHEFSGGSVSSQGSGYRPPSPDVIVVDQKIKVEDDRGSKNCSSKRKKQQNEGNAKDSRTTKYLRSLDNADSNGTANGEEEKKKTTRLMRNRESAQLSRQRKKHYVEDLEDKLRSMHSSVSELNCKLSFIMAENATLRQQLSGGAHVGMGAPQSGMFLHPAMAPMGYPWVPYPPYVVKPPGSQVPLVPIPRLKPKQPVSALKTKKSETKKNEVKTKKVASISFLGLLFFILLFGGLVPFLNVRYGEVGGKVPGGLGNVNYRFFGQHRGRVLSVNTDSNGSVESVAVGFSSGESDTYNRVTYERGRLQGNEWELERKGQQQQPLPRSDESVRLGNVSEPLVASLYVPRNDKLVKIDGNLIIYSVLASEKAMAFQDTFRKKNNRETGLAIPGDLAPAFAIPEVGENRGRQSHSYKNPTGGQKALASGSSDTLKDHLKPTAADGKLQQWFREGLAGPMLSSGMCTEVFQFDVSPASTAGAVVPASSVSNRWNATRVNRGRNRRILNSLPAPLAGSNSNFTEEHNGKKSQKEGFQGNKSTSPVIVSVLVDPRQAGDDEVDGMIKPKSLSRIFVVVLLDSVKYVTYSCVLPRAVPHLMTT